jgi:hypothetical protein
VQAEIIQSLAQLKLKLSQCTQNVIVPEIELMHDPEIRTKYEECKKAGRELSAEDFEERLKDPAFVKRIEKQVQMWVRDIRRITTLEHDP